MQTLKIPAIILKTLSISTYLQNFKLKNVGQDRILNVTIFMGKIQNGSIGMATKRKENHFDSNIFEGAQFDVCGKKQLKKEIPKWPSGPVVPCAFLSQPQSFIQSRGRAGMSGLLS